jgi:hypothetical protein
MSNLTDNLVVRFIVVFLAIASPFACVLIDGPLDSYSQYWTSDLRPLFVFTNAATSYYLFSSRSWWIPSTFLLLLTAFSYDQYFWIHNISAVCFFIASGISIMNSKKYQGYIVPYFSSMIFLVTFGILWAEIFAILVICVFHLHRMIKFYQIDTKRKKIKI